MVDKSREENPLERERRGLSLFSDIENEIRDRSNEDPFARFLLEGWKQVFICVLAVVAVIYIRNSYLKNQEANQEYAADRFAQVRQELEMLRSGARKTGESGSEKPDDAAAGKVNEALRALDETRDPYRNLAPLYSTLVSASKGGVPASEIRGVGDLPPASEALQRMVGELRLLVVARAKLGTPADIGDARKLLGQLASEGVYVNVNAAITLARIAGTPEEQKEAADILQSIRDRHPEQGKLVAPELRRFSPEAGES